MTRRLLLLIVALLAGCGKTMPPDHAADFSKVALDFGRSLAGRHYEQAYAMTTEGYRASTSLAQMKAAFEAIVPEDWGPSEPIEVTRMLETWPDKQAADIGWAYVSIYGDVYSEALIVVVALEQGQPRIRDVQFGRP